MEFVAFLKDLCDGVSWMLIISWDCLNSHMVVMVKLSISCDFLDSFFFQSMNQTFLDHFQALLHIICQAFNGKSAFKVIKRWQNCFCQILAAIALQELTLFIGTTLNVLHFCVGTKIFVFKLLGTFISQVQFRLLGSCFFYWFNNFLFFYFFIFYILGHFRLL
ncbi:Uncharacterised protein [Mycobacteroides abscessus subsp. abscessus]|nr:Uncharacterised protein [Mycobacteroides abscessus subsp. abscessus]